MPVPTVAHRRPTPRRRHDNFLALSPAVAHHARLVFRHLDADAREEAVAEAVAAAFEAHVALKARGRDAAAFPSMLATFAALHVKDGRHVGGRSSTRDVLSRKAQQQRGFRVQSLSGATGTAGRRRHAATGVRPPAAYEECLRDNTQTPVADQVAFRLDFADFLKTLTERDRRMALALAEGHAAAHVADRFGLTPGRVTQLRQQWRCTWHLFQGEPEPFAPAPQPA